jgi:hypothetical protein
MTYKSLIDRPKTVDRLIRESRQLIGWGWRPATEEIAAIQSGALIVFTESDTGGAYVQVQGVGSPTMLPSVNPLGASPEGRGSATPRVGPPHEGETSADGWATP